MKCEKCKHKEVCGFKNDMERLYKDATEKSKLLEYSNFGITIDCKHFFDVNTPIFSSKK